jgi:bifunctional enzyme CysN/CysC
MADVSGLMTNDIDSYLKQHETKSLLRFITCGSVGDGKSTLIGRLLYESKMLFDDQLAALEADAKKVSTRGGELDHALLVDGLTAEREQGITIDVAYHFFSTDRRKFVVADTPGHEHYTRNMVTGASTGDLAIILIDARKGMLVQTRRHSYLVCLIGIRHAVLAINKMDLVDYSQTVFDRIRAEYLGFAKQIGIEDVTVIPISGVQGDNIVEKSARTPWFGGPVLMRHLETVEVCEQRLQKLPFRLPVQRVNRPDLDFRGFSGTVAAGFVRPGDRVRVAPSGRKSTVARIITADGDLSLAVAHPSITPTLTDEVDISRGDVISLVESPAGPADQFEATLVWMSEQPMLRGRSYLMKTGTKTATATVMLLKYRVNVNNLEHVAAATLALNEVGVVGLELDPYAQNRERGGFILLNKLSNGTVGAGMLRFALRCADNIHWQAVDISEAALRALNGHGSAVIWLTGLSGPSKSSLANFLEKRLHAMGKRTYLLDGDNVRHGLNKNLCSTPADGVETIRRAAEAAKLLVDAGVIVLTASISPFLAERRMARNFVGSREFIEVFVNTPLAVAESRDPKGLYKNARRGELKNFTRIASPCEAPKIRIDTAQVTAEDAADQALRAAPGHRAAGQRVRCDRSPRGFQFLPTRNPLTSRPLSIPDSNSTIRRAFQILRSSMVIPEKTTGCHVKSTNKKNTTTLLPVITTYDISLAPRAPHVSIAVRTNRNHRFLLPC